MIGAGASASADMSGLTTTISVGCAASTISARVTISSRRLSWRDFVGRWTRPKGSTDNDPGIRAVCNLHAHSPDSGGGEVDGGC